MAQKKKNVVISPDTLHQVPFFVEFTPSELEELLSVMEVVSIPAGTVLMVENQICTPDFYVILSGSVDVVEANVRIATRKQNDILGELAFVVEHPRTATVAAATDCTLLRIDAIEVRALAGRNSQVAWKLTYAVARYIGERFIETDRRLRDLLKRK